MILATSGIIQSKAASAPTGGIITTDLLMYIDPSIVASSGATVYDYLGNNVGTINNSTGVLVNDPTVGKIFQLNGSDQFITLTNGITFDQGFTMQFIVKKSGSSGLTFLFSSLTGTKYVMYVDFTGFPPSYYLDTSNGANTFNPAFSSPSGYFMLTLINSNADNGITRIYKNKLTTTYDCITNNSVKAGTLNLKLGTYPSAGYWLGNIGAFMIYNRVLSKSEIDSNFDVAAARFGI